MLPLALLVLAAGCSGTKADAPAASVTVPLEQPSSATSATPTPSETVLTPQEMEYLKALGNKPDVSGMITFNPGDIEEGHAICGQSSESDDEDGWSEGAFSGPPTVDAIIENEWDGADYQAAVEHLCPKYLSVLRKAKGGFTDGTYEVGKDIKAGTYRTTPGRITDCYWERSTAGGATIANDFVKNAPGGVTVTLMRRGEGFTSEGCGNWMRG